MRKSPICIACRNPHVGKCATSKRKRKPITFMQRVRAVQQELLGRHATGRQKTPGAQLVEDAKKYFGYQGVG
jgi:hypothetical protein